LIKSATTTITTTIVTYREHVVTLLIDFLFFLRNVKLPEEVEGDHSVDVDHDRQQHHSQNLKTSLVGNFELADVRR
jgi:hypothetical protein